MAYFGYSRYPLKVRDPVDHLLGFFSFPLSIRQGQQTFQQLLFFLPRRFASLLEAPRTGARRKVLDVAEDHRHERGGAFAPTRPRDVDLAHAAHAVLVEEGPDGVSRLLSARDLRSSSRKSSSLDVLQKGDHVRMRADHVRDVQERQPHLRA